VKRAARGVQTVELMSGLRRILVTGAQGNVGREVVRALLARGVFVRQAVRDPDARPADLGQGNELVRFDFHQPETFETALEACDGLFLLRPPAIAKVKGTLNRLVTVALERGVQQIVFLSVAGAAKNQLVPHHAVETHLKTSAKGWTILRPGFFAQNLGDAYQRDILEDDRVYVPAGDGRVAFVHLRDIAEIAAAAFLEPERHYQQAYELTGGEALSFQAVAQTLTEALGRTIRYDAAGVLGYLRHLSRRGLPLAQALVQTILHVGLRWGQAQAIDPTLERLLGRRPLTLREYVRDNARLWTP